MRLVIATSLALMLIINPAFAQAVAATTTNTTLSLNDILGPWIPILVGAFMTLMLAMLAALTTFIKQRFNLEQDRYFQQVETQARETLQSALTNAAGRVVLQLGDSLKDIQLDVKLPEIKQAVLQVNNSAADAVGQFKLNEDDVANMIINKIGVVTAGNPAVVPTVVEASAPKPGNPA